MAFKHQVWESKELINRSDHYSTEICGYIVVLTVDNHLTELSIAPVEYGRMRLGILKCYPRSVEDIAKFADDAKGLFDGIVEQLREIGKDDLRSPSDKRHDEFQEKIRSLRIKAEAGAEPAPTSVTDSENTEKDSVASPELLPTQLPKEGI